jgi:septum site-determining protein MinC
LAGGAVVLDLSSIAPTNDVIAQLIASLRERGIAVMGFEGIEASALGSELPSLLTGQRHSATIDEVAAVKPVTGRRGKGRGKGKASVIAVASVPDLAVPPLHPINASNPLQPSETAAHEAKQSSSLVVESPVRSGQSVCFPEGDLTVLGAVGSGAEVLAGGSVHVYGTLRGRAMAGSGGNPRARIFCQRLEAEMLSIDGYYCNAEDIDEQLRGRPVQVWLDGNEIMITALN